MSGGPPQSAGTGAVAAPPPATVVHGERRLAVTGDGLSIGRRSDNGLVLLTDRVSRHHAQIAARAGRWWIADLGSTNGTYVNGERLCGESRWLESGDKISIGGETLRFVTGEVTTFEAPGQALEVTTRVEFQGRRMRLGRDASNEVVLDDPNVSRFHAEVVAAPHGFELRDLGSRNGTRLSGELVTRSRLDSGAEIGIGPYRLVFDGSAFVAEDERGALRLDAHGLAVNADGRVILAGADLSFGPGELVAIVGESGSGKTTLVKALAGVTIPDAGTVTVSGAPVWARRTDVGYVPQEDIVHAALTVREALCYSARLRLPHDSSRTEVDAAVDRVLHEVALTEQADTRIAALSGGQRKRTSVAVELLGRPSLVLLDEPTTGLDPELESRMMSLLRRLADGSRGVAVVTHATKNLNLCDKLAVMGRGGEVLFFGPPDEALAFFGTGSYDGIYRTIAERPTVEWKRLAATAAPTPAPAARPAEPVRPGRPARRRLLPQARVLTGRYVRLIGRDRRNLLIMLGQVPLLAVAAAGLFKQDVFSHAQSGLAANAAQLVFLLVTTAIWLGSVDAAREIVKERAVYQRESAAGVRLGAYLASKVVVLFALAAVQTSALAAIVFALRPLHEPPAVYGAAVLLLVLTSFVAVSMGLFISAAVRTQDQATSFIPLALIPQLFFAGAIVPLTKMGEPIATLSAGAFAQWSFAGLGTELGMNDRIASDPEFSKTSSYGTAFFDVELLSACAILAAFLGITLLVVGVLLRGRTR